jgi:pilus assembly protein CpaB
MRGVSVSVAAESASGGFIVPNDHVDVVLTLPPGMGQASETILHNVRVLAINTRLGETGTTGAPTDPDDPRAEIFADEAIATLELDPTQAEVIINASTVGRLALVLRSITDFTEIDRIEQRPANAAIRISSPFWASEANGQSQ